MNHELILEKPKLVWTQADAIELCRVVEVVCPQFGCHVALTGGLLYKEGPRKDCDLLIYHIRQQKNVDFVGLEKALVTMGFSSWKDYGWVKKCTYHGKPVDIFDPEVDDTETATRFGY